MMDSQRLRLAALSLAMALTAWGLLTRPQAATAQQGCHTFQNSQVTFFPDPSDPLGGTYNCAGTATTSCRECITPDPPDGGFTSCVQSEPDDTYCRSWDQL